MSSFLILKRCLSSSSSSSSILLVESMYSLSIAPRRSLISQVVNNNHQKNHCNINSHLTNLRSNLNNGCSLNSCLQMRFSTLSSSSNLTLGRKSSVEKESTLTSKKVVEPLVAAKKITKTSQAGQANKPSETSKVVKADKLKLTDSVNKVAKVVKGDKVDKTDKVEKKQPTKSIKVSNSQKDIVSAANKEIKQGVEKPEIEKLVSLAHSFDNYKDKVDFSSQSWYFSRKLDGVRLIATANLSPSNTIDLHTRTGKPVNTLPSVENDLIKLLDGNVLLKSEDFKKLKSSSNTLVKKAIQRIEMILSTTNPVEVVFDGEIVVLGVNGGDNMRGTMSSIMNESQFSKLGEVEENRYAIFDLLTQAEFSNKKSEDPLSVRILALYILMFKQLPKIPLPNEFSTSDTLITTAVQPTNWMVSSSPNFNSLYFVNQHLVKSTQHLTLVFNSILECHYEGLMIRKDTGYKGGRNPLLLKLKSFKDAEFKVLRTISGPMKLNGSDTPETVLASVIIDYKGSEVSVGSGFTAEERRLYHKNPNLIIGKIITVQYFDESQNKKGKVSLRFPIFKYCHGDKRTA